MQSSGAEACWYLPTAGNVQQVTKVKKTRTSRIVQAVELLGVLCVGGR